MSWNAKIIKLLNNYMPLGGIKKGNLVRIEYWEIHNMEKHYSEANINGDDLMKHFYTASRSIKQLNNCVYSNIL